MNRIKRVYLGSNDGNPNIPVVWTLQKLIELLRVRFKDFDEELKVYENMTVSHYLDTSELMKIINLSYIDEENDD
jgi:hypothetical protein